LQLPKPLRVRRAAAVSMIDCPDFVTAD